MAFGVVAPSVTQSVPLSLHDQTVNGIGHLVAFALGKHSEDAGHRVD